MFCRQSRLFHRQRHPPLEAHAPAFPRQVDGYSPRGEVTQKLLYVVRATPTLMLIGPDGKVELKDPSPEQLLRQLGR